MQDPTVHLWIAHHVRMKWRLVARYGLAILASFGRWRAWDTIVRWTLQRGYFDPSPSVIRPDSGRFSSFQANPSGPRYRRGMKSVQTWFDRWISDLLFQSTSAMWVVGACDHSLVRTAKHQVSTAWTHVCQADVACVPSRYRYQHPIHPSGRVDDLRIPKPSDWDNRELVGRREPWIYHHWHTNWTHLQLPESKGQHHGWR